MGSLINMNKIDGRTYTSEQKIEQYVRAAELDISFTPQGPTSRRINELQTNQCKSYADNGEAYPGLLVHQMESVDNHNVNDYVYDDHIPEHPMLSIFRTNHTDPSTGKETREFRLPMSLWKNMGPLRTRRDGSQSRKVDVPTSSNTSHLLPRTSRGMVMTLMSVTRETIEESPRRGPLP